MSEHDVVRFSLRGDRLLVTTLRTKHVILSCSFRFVQLAGRWTTVVGPRQNANTSCTAIACLIFSAPFALTYSFRVFASYSCIKTAIASRLPKLARRGLAGRERGQRRQQHRLTGEGRWAPPWGERVRRGRGECRGRDEHLVAACLPGALCAFPIFR